MKATSNNVMKRDLFGQLLLPAVWGISGTTVQFISQNQNLPADWYLSIRTMGAGVILLIISLFMYGKKTFGVFSSWRTFGSLLAYAIFGLMANLLTFYISDSKR